MPSQKASNKPSRLREKSSGKRIPFHWDQADAYLFDIDGTLLNTRDGVHYYAFHDAVRATFGVPASLDGVWVHGNTDIGILRAVLKRAGVPEEEVEYRLPQFVQHMCAEVQRHAERMEVELCPAIAELLETLRARNKLLGVVTGNLEIIGWAKIQAAGLRDYFTFGCFSDRHPERESIFRQGLREVGRRLGRRALACFVGDTPADIQAAKAVGAPIIAVATGIYPAEKLCALQPDLCISCCSDLLAYRR